MAKLKVNGDSPDGLKLAANFWKGIGSPKEFAKQSVFEDWSHRLEKLAHKVSLPYSQFRWFIIWCTRLPDDDGAAYGNTFTARNLRVAKNPMGSLEKQFATTYHEIFLPQADKLVGLLQDRVQREQDDRSRTAAPKRITYYDLCISDPQNPLAWEVEKARWLTAIDERFPLLEPAPGEEIEDWVYRMFLPFRASREWRCNKCVYGVGEDGDLDERVKWCEDCGDELRIDMADDMEELEEVPVVSWLTLEWT